ncbi:MAG: response regulator, partial [Candidatus Lokiarchaeota archaeon]|nr:response regulator [Candidatus Lokiarchaeota archaeon]MBD3341935.1 response regulator [Candidatus Lokiarchaeota archaeon]
LEEIINESLTDRKPVESEFDILIIDDDTATLAVLSQFFESKGYTSYGAITGAKGLNLLAKSIPKIILLDIILPDINGYELCQKIKEDKNLEDVPVFYITAVPESDVAEKMEETGAEDYFLKPFKFDQFDVIFEYLEG